MGNSLLQITPRPNSLKFRNLHRILINTHISKSPNSIHTTTAKDPNQITHMLCDSFRRDKNWDSLTKQFRSIPFTDQIVEKVLLELKNPIDAKRALNFFNWSANRAKSKHGVRCYCIAIHILVRARLIVEAKALIESVVKESSGLEVLETLISTSKIEFLSSFSNSLAFDLLVQTYSKLRMFLVAFDACKQLEQNGYSCSVISFNALIHVVQKSHLCGLSWEIYEFMIEKRAYPNETTVEMMIGVLCKMGELKKCVDLLDRIHGGKCPPMVIVNAHLVFKVFGEGRIGDGVVLLRRLLMKNMILDDVAFSMVVYGRVRDGDMVDSQEVFEEMLKRGFRANAFLYTLFIGAYCDEGRAGEARRLKREMRDVGLKAYDDTYNVLIEGCCRCGELEESLSLCEEMVEGGMLPSCSTYNVMVGKLRNVEDVKRANGLLTVLLDKGFVPNEATYANLIDAYGREGEVQEVFKLYYEMDYKGCSPGLMAYTSLIISLCQCGRLKEAEKFLKVMEDRSVAPSLYIYETLIGGYYKSGDMHRALDLFNEMNKQGLSPNGEGFTEMMERIHSSFFLKEEWKDLS
ncbi:hypothetical protein Scep_022884 [Stephania cephalantha]|uniref:Pentatricopeptide repeat-containing protein n=1 Tax=Stephania cephalantha TaxID=152367 RepID=A0AAP0F8R7_9MAGN